MPNISTASEPPKRKATPMMCGIGSSLFFAPVLRAHNDCALACTDDQHLQQKLHLIAQAYAAHGILTVPSEHHSVHQVYAVGEQVLQRQRQCSGFIKRLFPLSPQQPFFVESNTA